MLTFYVNVLFVTKRTCKCAHETNSQCQLSHSVHTICWCSRIVVSGESSLGKYLPAFQTILVTSSLGSSSTRGAAAALVLLDPDHDIIKIIWNIGNSLSVHLCDNQEDFNPYPTVLLYGNGMVLNFYQQQESSTTKTVHKVINKGLKTYV